MEEISTEKAKTKSPRNKTNILIAAVFVVLLITAGFLGFTYLNSNNCSLKVIYNQDKPDNFEIYKCGYMSTTENGTLDNYFGKIEKFYASGNQFFVTINFGLVSRSFPIGEDGVDKILIVPRHANSYIEEMVVNDKNLVDLTMENINDLNKRYAGSFTAFSLATVQQKDSRISRANEIKNNASSSARLVKIADREEAYWQNCTTELGKILSELKSYGSVKSLSGIVMDLVSKKYNPCTPIVTSFNIFVN